MVIDAAQLHQIAQAAAAAGNSGPIPITISSASNTNQSSTNQGKFSLCDSCWQLSNFYNIVSQLIRDSFSLQCIFSTSPVNKQQCEQELSLLRLRIAFVTLLHKNHQV